MGAGRPSGRPGSAPLGAGSPGNAGTGWIGPRWRREPRNRGNDQRRLNPESACAARKARQERSASALGQLSQMSASVRPKRLVRSRHRVQGKRSTKNACIGDHEPRRSSGYPQ
nr:hypothetical protein [Sinorhizobium glycinis]